MKCTAAAMVWMMTAALAGCSAGALNGHAAPALSAPQASAPGSTSSAAGGPGSGSAPGSGGQPATTPSSRPYRPNSVVLGLFKSTFISPPCVAVAAGSSDTAFTLQRFVVRGLCFFGLNALAPPSIEITTPDGTQETMPLLGPGSDEWKYVLLPVPGQGAEASLGEYSFQVTTAMAGTGSASASAATSPAPSPSITTSPAASVVTTSGHFTVIPATQPSVAIGSDPLTASQQATVSAGSQLSIWFSGFPSFSLVYASLYGPGVAGKAPLLTDLPALKTDQYGEADLTWTVPSSAATARYAVWIDPTPAGVVNPCLAFTVRP
jgi:hypothetical protein